MEGRQDSFLGDLFRIIVAVILPPLGVLLPCALVVAYIYLSEVIGAAPMMLLIMLTLLIQRGVRLMPSLVISLVATAVISLSFGHLLKVPLPIGPLGF